MTSSLQPEFAMVSVVIPCHNASRWISHAIESVLGQTHPRIELIVVDDSSTDGSAEVIKQYGDRLTFVSGKWGNGSSSRNAGLERARGDWVQFLDADDELLPGKIRSQLSVTDAAVDVVYSPVIIRESNEQGIWSDVVMRSRDPLDLASSWLLWELCQTGGVLWRTEALRKIGGWQDGLPCCQDNELAMRALMSGLRFRYDPCAGAVYRIWSDDTVCRKDPTRVREMRVKLMETFIEWLIERDAFGPPQRTAAGRAFFEMARGWAKTDLAAADRFFSAYRRRGLIQMTGPAAPPAFRCICHMMGFAMAERFAAWMRSLKIKGKAH